MPVLSQISTEKAGVGGSIPSLATMFLKDLLAFPYYRRLPVESIWSPNSKKGSWYPSFFDEYRSMFLIGRELVPMVFMGAVSSNVVLRIARQIFFLIYRGTTAPVGT